MVTFLVHPGSAKPVSVDAFDAHAPAADDDAAAHADVKHGGDAPQPNGRNGPRGTRSGGPDGPDERPRGHAAADEPADDDADAAAAADADAAESAAASGVRKNDASGRSPIALALS